MKSIILILIAVFSSFLATVRADERPTVVLGATMPLTGDISFYGTGFKNSATMALENLGPTRYQYKLEIEDDQGKANQAVANFHKLTDFANARTVISATANIAIALAQVARRKEVLHLGLSSDPSFADAEYNFNIWPAPHIPVQKLLDQFEKRKIKKVALFGLEHAWPRAVFADFVARSKAAGIVIAMHEYFSPGETNFRPVLGRFRSSGADIGVLLSWSPELEIFARQHKELQINIPLTSEFAFESSTEPSLFNNLWFVNLNSASPGYREQFKQRFGYLPYSQMEMGDLILRLLVQAYEDAGDGKTVPTVEAVAKQLLKVKDRPSVFGNFLINSKGVLEAPYVVKIIKDGQAQTIAD